MDLQRSLLIGAIAVLSFMLLTEWVAFKDAKSAAIAEETTRLIAHNEGITPDLPTPVVDASPSTADDLPSAPEEEVNTAAANIAKPVKNANIIEVYTDVLQLAIDLHGGDIIELSLRKYLEELNDPNQPFVLLEDNDALVEHKNQHSGTLACYQAVHAADELTFHTLSICMYSISSLIAC